jgi:RNA polymerase sigma-70 factor (ECF subfamily)
MMQEGAGVNDQHDPDQLSAYALGLLEREDARAIGTHVAECPRCRQELTQLREVDDALRGMSAEFVLDGPPPDGELVLQRTLRQLRQESGARAGRRRLALVAAAVTVLVGVGAAGVVIGRGSTGETVTAETEAGSRQLTGVNPATGAKMTVTLTPEAGWVRVQATVNGLAVGERCMLVVVDRRGNHSVVSSWVVAPTDEDYRVDSGAAVAPKDVAAVKVQNFGGRELLIAPA